MQDVTVPIGYVPAELQEKVLMGGDLSKLTIPERLSYYKAVCESVGLNPLTRPFEYLVLDDKMVLYARKDCTDQLRELHGISIEIVSRERVDDLFVVTARAKNMTERVDESTGAVPAAKEDGEWKTSQNGRKYFQGSGIYKPLSLEARSNAMMKAETKAKRRVTLSICGLGVLDESEIDGLPDAKRMVHAEEPDRKYTRAELVDLTTAQQEPAAVLEPTTEEALKEMGQAETPASPYIAKVNTAHDEKGARAAYEATPEELKQDVYPAYTTKLKALARKK